MRASRRRLAEVHIPFAGFSVTPPATREHRLLCPDRGTVNILDDRLVCRGDARGPEDDGLLDAMQGPKELRALPTWNAHALTGARRGTWRGTWSLHVTRNWRLTFRIEGDEIVDLNLEDDH